MIQLQNKIDTRFYTQCYGPSGKAGATQPSFIHFMDASLRVLLKLLDQHSRYRSSWAWLTPG